MDGRHTMTTDDRARRAPRGRQTPPPLPLTSAVHRFLDGSRPTPSWPASGSTSEHDALLALLAVHDLWTAPIDQLGDRVRFQHHPEVVALKVRLEDELVERLDARSAPETAAGPGHGTAAIRRLAVQDLVPEVYGWLADEATLPEVVDFLAVEGGPDADFDDLVALAQVGIGGGAKVALATNYWDELGRGDIAAVHTVLHDRLVAALAMPRIARADLPTSALARKAINGLLVTNRRLQPEALGALGLIEMQAGPRCRAVVRALERLDAPAGALPFYREHAQADPRHGKDWVDQVIDPLATSPSWAAGMVRGAAWRHEVNRRFFADMARRFCPERVPGAGRATSTAASPA